MFTSKVDLGTGTGTALGQIVAEELDVAVLKIRMEIGDTTRSVDQGRTSASRTLERAGPQMRQAAAAARQELLARASLQLGTPVNQLAVTDGVVSVTGNSAKSVSYAALVGGRPFGTKVPASGEQWDLNVAPDVKPKNPREYKVVGTSVPRFDLPDKFAAAFTYAQDVRVPGMLHGRVIRPPVVNSTPLSVDEGIDQKYPGREDRTEGQLRRHRGRDRVGGDSCRARAEGDVVRSSDAIPGGSRGDVRLSAEHEAADRARGDQHRQRGGGIRTGIEDIRRRRIDGRSRCTG